MLNYAFSHHDSMYQNQSAQVFLKEIITFGSTMSLMEKVFFKIFLF